MSAGQNDIHFTFSSIFTFFPSSLMHDSANTYLLT